MKTIQSGVITTLLEKIKLPPTYQRVLVFAPHQEIGPGIPDFGFIRGLYNFKKLMAHLRTNKALGTIMHIVMEWYQITTRIREIVLLDTTKITYLYYPLVHSLREFLHRTRAEVKYPEMWTPKPQRRNNRCIMDTL